MPRPMPPHTLMVGSQLMAAATAILALLPLAVAPFQTPGGRVRVSLSAASFLLFLQCFLGPARRRSSSFFVQYGSWVAYHAPFYLATYAAGNLYLLSSHEELDILRWGIVLLHALYPMPHMMAYYQGDYGHSSRKMNNAKSLGYMVTFFHAVYVTKTCTVMSFVLLLAYVLYCTAVGRVWLPIRLSWLHNDDEDDASAAGSDEEDAPAAVSDEDDTAVSDEDDASAAVYDEEDAPAAVSDEDDTAVSDEEDAPAAVSDEDEASAAVSHEEDAPAAVSHEEDAPAAVSDEDATAAVSHKDDLVFSYKLFKRMLKPLYQERLVTKARELLSHEDGEDRAFQVVEVQLAFLYDEFFTASNTYYINMVDEFIDDIPTATFCIFAGFFVWPLIHGLTLTLYSRSGLVLTALVLVLDWLRGPVRFARLWASDWGKALLAQRKTQGKTARPPFIDNLCNVISYFPVFNSNGKRYWQEMIGQYSLLQDYNRGNRWKAVVAQAVALAESTWSPAMSETHHPREEEDVSLPQDLKLKLRHSLASARDRVMGVTSGCWVLGDKVPVDVLISTLQEKNYANTILIWHIATCYLDMDKDYGVSEAKSKYDIATKLSKYCAYLVAFLPELLPREAQATSKAFQSVVQETSTALKDAPSEEDKYNKMKALSHVGQHSSLPTFEAGVALAKRLQGIFPVENFEAHIKSERIEALWDLLADFWVETILYIAPCNSTAKHIDMLARGGELITHVWAMLLNTGMMVRVPVKIADSRRPEGHVVINAH